MRLPDILSSRSARGVGPFRRHIGVPTKRWPTSCRPPFGHFRHHAPQRRGPERQRILALCVLTAQEPRSKAIETKAFEGERARRKDQLFALSPSGFAPGLCSHALLVGSGLLCHKGSRAPDANGGARPACSSTWPKNAPAFSAFPPSMAVRAASSGRPPFAEERRSWQHCCHGMQLHRIGDAGAMAFTPGILPYAIRASFAVRAAPAAQWLLSADKSSGTI